MIFDVVIILILLVIALAWITGKECRINITVNHKYDTPPAPAQLDPEVDDEKESVKGVVEALNNFMNGGSNI